ncbi:MAG: M56 family metallopeptidase [Chitinophagaceae bacterium]
MMMPYIINTALILGACLAFYKILLRRETFYKVNRYLLIVCLVVSFALPLLPVPQQFSLRNKETPTAVVVKQPKQTFIDQLIQQTPTLKQNTKPPNVVSAPAPAPPVSFSFAQLMNWLFWIYWFGVIVFAASFIFQLLLLIYRAYRNPVIIDGKYRIVEVSGDKAPCSFGNTIFINPEKYDWETYNQILLHEKIHIREKHTIDILIAEFVLIFQWFNPFAWIYRREIESNLEFLTDDQLIKQEVDKKSYQLSLVKVSVPHLPLSLTTNYNQSILKKRITMMNAKKSSLHTAWKYFFLLPVLAILACLLNQPIAKSQTSVTKNEKHVRDHGMETEGYWFAVIKDDKVNIHFSDEKMEDDKDVESGRHSYNSSTFNLSDLSNVQKGTAGTFTISREAGKMELTGKFEGNTGMGRYKFVADKAYVDYMNKELNEKLDDDDQMAFFFINIRKDYLQMLKSEGFAKITKDDIIPMAAMKIDGAYIKSIKESGFKDVSLENLIPLKALKIDASYIKEIREAGYKNVTTDQLVSFKAQGIDKDYIGKVRRLRGNDHKDGEDDADDIVSFKAMGITEEFINSFKSIGVADIPNDELVSFKAVGVTPEYIKGWQALGFKDIKPEEFVGMKSQNITPEYMKTFTDMGYKDVKPEELVAFKALNITPEFVKSFEAMGYKDIKFDQLPALKSLNITPEFIRSFAAMGYKNIDMDQLPALKSLNITPEYIRSFEALGYKNIDIDELPALKSQNITPEFIKSFEAVGFKNISLDEIVSVKAVGVTPDYIREMKAKGFNYNSLEKYVRLKTID